MYIDQDGNGYFKGFECHAVGYEAEDDLILFLALEGPRKGDTIRQWAYMVSLKD